MGLVVTRKRVALAYVLLVLFGPVISVGDVAFRVELLVAPALLFAMVVRDAGGGVKVPAVVWLMLAWWTWMLVRSLGVLASGQADRPILWVSMYSYLRLALVVMVFYNLRVDRATAESLTRTFGYAAVLLGILAVAQAMGWAPAEWLTRAAYSSPTRTSVLDLIQRTGSLLRATATFESPAYAAIFFLLALGTSALWLVHPSSPLSRGRRRWLVVSALLAGVGGVMTLSATFLLGTAVLTVWMLMKLPLVAKFRVAMLGLAVVVGVSIVVGVWVSRMPRTMDSLSYQLGRIADASVFRTRYDTEEGLLAEAVNQIKQHPIVGLGANAHDGVFVGDSFYVVTLYYGGLIGLALMALVLLHVAVRSTPKTGIVGEVVLLWLVLLAATGIASPSLFVLRISDLWWALVGVAVWRSHHESRYFAGGDRRSAWAREVHGSLSEVEVVHTSND